MSELKVIDVDKMADVRSLSGRFYRKSDVDAVIAEKDMALEYAKALTLKDIETIKEKDKEIAELKQKLEDAKRDACRFEKAMYRASFNWAHARSFIYMKEHYASMKSEIPRQWRRALDLCKLGYDFAKIAQDKLPKKPKPEQETTEV